MTKMMRALLQVIAETRIKDETICIAMCGGASVTLRDVEVDEETGLFVGKNVATWPDLKRDDGPSQIARTFTGRIEMVSGFWA